MSKIELAKKIGVYKSTISRYERGITYPSIERLALISEVLDVDKEDLFDEYCVFRSNFSQHVRELRKTLGLTQKQFGELLDGQNHHTIGDWESNIRMPKDKVVFQILTMHKTL